MKLQTVMTMMAGGPGSGCHGENCGRPRVHELMQGYERVKSLREDARMTKSNVRFYKRKGNYESARRSDREAAQKQEEAKTLKKQLDEQAKEALHEDFGKWKSEGIEHRSMVGRFETWSAPNGDKLEASYVTGWAKQGVSGGYALRLVLKDGSRHEMLLDHNKLHQFVKHHFGITLKI